MVLLLCAKLGQRHDVAKPLTPKQYSALAKWLRERSLRPRDLLQDTVRTQLADLHLTEVARDQVERLLDRGAALGMMVERWTNSGIWIVGRGDEQYPARYKTCLGHRSPPIIYGVGELPSLQTRSLAVVGSRNASKENLAFAQRVGVACADQGIVLISGAAKGIDLESMMSAVNRKGTAIGVLADGLGRTAVAPAYHEAIVNGYLTLISPYEPESRWFAFTAMERNKLIYALADAALVVAWSNEEGGTWTGAMEALKRGQTPVYIKGLRELPSGNRKLIEYGAQESPGEPWVNLCQLFAKSSPPNTPSVDDRTLSEGSESGDVSVSEQPVPDSLKSASTPATLELAANQDRNGSDAYDHIVEIMLELLAEPMGERSIAEKLNVSPSQAKAWLKRAVDEGRVEIIKKRPARYVRRSAALPLFAHEPEAGLIKRS